MIPDEILHRPKEGFAPPLAGWLRGELKPLIMDLLLSPSANVTAVLKTEYVANLVREHFDSEVNHARKIWALLCLEMWCEVYQTSLH